uniref:Uncharacterized protein n=1 Tax=Fagus sylvatica TaxID=28930 RepID=A0A2N9G9Y1_FAGSY
MWWEGACGGSVAEEKDETGQGVNSADEEEGGEGALDGLRLGIGFWDCGGLRGMGVVWIVGVTRRGRPVGRGDGLGCGKCIIPIFERNMSIGEERKTGFKNMTVLAFNGTILLMCMWTR